MISVPQAWIACFDNDVRCTASLHFELAMCFQVLAQSTRTSVTAAKAAQNARSMHCGESSLSRTGSVAAQRVRVLALARKPCLGRYAAAGRAPCAPLYCFWLLMTTGLNAGLRDAPSGMVLCCNLSSRGICQCHFLWPLCRTAEDINTILDSLISQFDWHSWQRSWNKRKIHRLFDTSTSSGRPHASSAAAGCFPPSRPIIWLAYLARHINSLISLLCCHATLKYAQVADVPFKW